MKFDVSKIVVDNTSYCETNEKYGIVRYPVCYEDNFDIEDFFGIPMMTYDDMYSLLDYFPYDESMELTCYMPTGQTKTLNFDKNNEEYEVLKNTVEQYSTQRWGRSATELLNEEWHGISDSI